MEWQSARVDAQTAFPQFSRRKQRARKAAMDSPASGSRHKRPSNKIPREYAGCDRQPATVRQTAIPGRDQRSVTVRASGRNILVLFHSIPGARQQTREIIQITFRHRLESKFGGPRPRRAADLGDFIAAEVKQISQ